MNVDDLISRSVTGRCCSDFKLDRYSRGELDDDEAALVTAHLAASPVCAARLATLQATRDTFIATMPPLSLPTPSSSPSFSSSLSRRRVVAAVSGFAALAAAVVIAVVVAAPGDGDDLVRTKGTGLAATVTFYVARAGVVSEATTDAPLLVGDVVRARVSAQQRGHVAVVEVEADGRVAALVPDDGLLQAVDVGETELAGAGRLDDSVGAVDFVALLCRETVVVDDDVRADIARDVAPAGCRLEHHRFTKAAR